jgi:hypothetical protein
MAMTSHEAEARLHEVAPAVAKGLGWDLIEREDRHLVEMVAPEGFHVYFNAGWTGGYDKVSGTETLIVAPPQAAPPSEPSGPR